MYRKKLIKSAAEFVEKSKDNYISKEIAISEDVVGMKMFEEPVFAFGDADDCFFELLKEKKAVGDHFVLPREWLPSGKTIVSFFLPFSKKVKESNRIQRALPSEGWLHARIEGQDFIEKLCRHIESDLLDLGYKSIIPSYDDRFWAKKNSKKEGQHKELAFTSNWSERHVAYTCGLGTFGLSKGLITKKGVAGRFGSLVTELELSPSEREYSEIYEYCSMCGKCAENCPANAISIENGKDHEKCSKYLLIVAKKTHPRYGCGKCQVNVPCQNRIPKK